MAECAILIDDSSCQEVGSLEPMGFAQCIELETISN